MKSPNGLGVDVPGNTPDSRRRLGFFSIRLRRGPTVAIIAGALLWAGLIALWRLL
jgi:hypothetical protein